MAKKISTGDIHQHPEHCRIKNIEPRNWWPKGLHGSGYEVRDRNRGTGVVGVMRNGRGPTGVDAR